MESFCDSDLYSAQTLPPDESDIETQLLAEQENDNKQDIIDNLQKELSICRAQFEQSAAINKKIENVHNKNQKLTADLRNLQSEKEELARRLEISLKTTEDLESKLNEIRFTSSQQISRETDDKEKEISKIKTEYENTINTMTNKISTLETANENLELTNKMQSNQIDRILQNSSQYFGFTFTKVDSLIEYLLQPRINESPRPENPTKTIDNSTLSLFQNKTRLLKQKLKESHHICSKIIKENAKLKKKLQDQIKTQNLVQQSYESQIEQIKEDNESSTALLNEKLSSLTGKVDKLKNDNQKLKGELKELRLQKVEIPEPSPEKVEKAEPKIKCNHISVKNEFEVLNRRNEELLCKLQTSEEKNDELRKKLKEVQESKTHLTVEIESTKAELSSLKIVHEETLNEVTSLRDSLHNRSDEKAGRVTKNKSKNKKMLCETKFLLMKLKTKIDHLQKKSELFTQQNHELQLQVHNERRQRDSLESELGSVKVELEESQAKVASLNDEVLMLRQRQEEKPPITVEDVIPSYAWRFSEFDEELSQRIEKVSLNPILQPSSKLNAVYKVIQKYIVEIVKQKDDNYQQLFDEVQDMKTRMNKFIVDASILLNLSPLTICDFLNKGGNETILQKLSHLVQENENLKRKEANLASIVELVVKTFDIDGSQNSSEFDASRIQSLIASSKDRMILLSEKLMKKCDKLRKLKEVLKETKNRVSNEMRNMRSESEEQKKLIFKQKEDNDKLREKNQQLKREVDKCAKKLDEIEEGNEERESKAEEEYERKMTNALNAHKMTEDRLKKQVETLLKDKEESRTTIENYEHTINHLRAVIEKSHRSEEARERSIAKSRIEREVEIESQKEKFQSEKDQVVKCYEKTISEMKKQLESARKDIERLSSDLSVSEKKNKVAKQSIVSLKRENIRLEREMKGVVEEASRERQISEADTRNKIMSADTNFRRKLNDYKSKSEEEKKRIFSFAASEFRQFFNASEIIDEKSFRSLVSRIRNEYEKLSTSDSNVRRLVCALPHQPTEEAVARIMSSMK